MHLNAAIPERIIGLESSLWVVVTCVAKQTSEHLLFMKIQQGDQCYITFSVILLPVLFLSMPHSNDLCRTLRHLCLCVGWPGVD